MQLKDHYQVLHVSPAASAEEIKKAFRALAMRFHPDKNREPFAAARFAEIQEAWHVLGDKTRRSAYNYQRYIANPQQASRSVPRSGADVLRLSAALYEKALRADPFRTDLDLRYFEIKDILSPVNIRLLLEDNDPVLKAKLVDQLSYASEPLGLAAIVDIVTQLKALDPSRTRQLDGLLKHARWQHYWNRSKIFVALAAAIVFCAILLLIVRE